MANLNKVMLIGRLAADPELRRTQNDLAVTSFSVAVNRPYRKDQAQQAVDFIDVVAWRNQAEFVTKYFKKGSMIGIEGAIQTRKYVDKDTGKNRTAFEVIANNVQFVESRRDDATVGGQAAPSFNNTDSGEFAEIAADDDLPF